GWSVTSYYYKTNSHIDQKMVEEVTKNAFHSAYYSIIARQIADAEKTGLYSKEFLLEQKVIAEKSVDSAAVALQTDLIPLDKIHFAPEFDGFHEPANPKKTYTLVILAIVIIIIAYINYVNFFFSRVPQRIKNINTMKIFGSSRSHLVLMLVTESLLFTLVSMAIASVIVYAVAPSVLSNAVDMESVVFSNHKMLVISILLPILTSIAVSIYPALNITNVDPALALKGNVTHRHDFALRYILIGFQITASTVLIIASMFIHKNVDYILDCDLGFNTQNLLAVETSQRISEHREEVRSLLLQNPDITDITWAHSELIANIRHHIWRSLPNEEGFAFDVVFVADNFFDFMDIDIVEGRGFLPSDYQSENGVYIFNKYTRDSYNMTLNQVVGGLNGPLCEIVGFCDDVKFKPLRYEMSPFAFHIPGKFTPDYATLKQLYIRISDKADVKKTKRYIHDALTQIDPDFPSINHPVRFFQQEMMDGNYYKETELARMISLFAFIAILISVMGIFGIVYFETERRRKEIGIRRVNGATIWEILSLFNYKFLKISAICSVIAIPIAFFFVQKYFSGFAYHYPINIWVFAMAAVLAISVTLLVVTAASFRAAYENPVKTLKNDE
ncbi:MAG: FtsX-like permease family protein, partial [Bacteroidales bacterium]|nr:FtsX-like permease family protein [Bacteroidales bacterium]